MLLCARLRHPRDRSKPVSEQLQAALENGTAVSVVGPGGAGAVEGRRQRGWCLRPAYGLTHAYMRKHAQPHQRS